MMVVGIPWAFYVKPWIMRGRKRKIQRELAAKAELNGTGTGQSVHATESAGASI